MLWKAIAGSHDSRQRYGDALDAAARAYRHAERTYAGTPNQPNLVNIGIVYARVLGVSDRHAEAVRLIERAIEAASATYGPTARQVGIYLQYLTVTQARVGDLQAAARQPSAHWRSSSSTSARMPRTSAPPSTRWPSCT